MKVSHAGPLPQPHNSRTATKAWKLLSQLPDIMVPDGPGVIQTSDRRNGTVIRNLTISYLVCLTSRILEFSRCEYCLIVASSHAVTSQKQFAACSGNFLANHPDPAVHNQPTS